MKCKRTVCSLWLSISSQVYIPQNKGQHFDGFKIKPQQINQSNLHIVVVCVAIKQASHNEAYNTYSIKCMSVHFNVAFGKYTVLG